MSTTVVRLAPLCTLDKFDVTVNRDESRDYSKEHDKCTHCCVCTGTAGTVMNSFMKAGEKPMSGTHCTVLKSAKPNQVSMQSLKVLDFVM